MDNDKLNKLLNYDSLHEAEKITGKSYKEDALTESIGFINHIKHSKIKSEVLKSIGDSQLSNKEDDYLKIVNSIGFESVLVEPFKNVDGLDERLHVMWNKEFSILLTFDTYNMGNESSVNGGSFYYNWSHGGGFKSHPTSSGGLINHSKSGYSFYFNEDLTPHYLPDELIQNEPKLSDYSWQVFKEKNKIFDKEIKDYVKENKLVTIWSGSHDCRVAIKHKINQLSENGTFIKKWKKRPFIWLLHYMDTKKDGYDYKEINKNRVSKLPKYVIDCIGDYK